LLRVGGEIAVDRFGNTPTMGNALVKQQSSAPSVKQPSSTPSIKQQSSAPSASAPHSTVHLPLHHQIWIALAALDDDRHRQENPLQHPGFTTDLLYTVFASSGILSDDLRLASFFSLLPPPPTLLQPRHFTTITTHVLVRCPQTHASLVYG